MVTKRGIFASMEIDFRFTAVSILVGYAAFALLERIPALRLRESRFWRPYFATDVGWYLAVVTITVAFGPAFEGLARVRADLGLPGLDSLGLPWAAQVVVALVLYDFGTFAAHVLVHHYDFLWRLHKVHHSSPVLDWLATTRAHGLEHLARGIPVQAALFALGVPVSAIATAIAIYAAFATLGHSNLRIDLAWLEWLFVTPRLHHLHHAPETTQRNFGTVFTIWDRLFDRLTIGSADPGECRKSVV